MDFANTSTSLCRSNDQCKSLESETETETSSTLDLDMKKRTNLAWVKEVSNALSSTYISSLHPHIATYVGSLVRNTDSDNAYGDDFSTTQSIFPNAAITAVKQELVRKTGVTDPFISCQSTECDIAYLRIRSTITTKNLYEVLNQARLLEVLDYEILQKRRENEVMRRVNDW